MGLGDIGKKACGCVAAAAIALTPIALIVYDESTAQYTPHEDKRYRTEEFDDTVRFSYTHKGGRAKIEYYMHKETGELEQKMSGAIGYGKFMPMMPTRIMDSDRRIAEHLFSQLND